jgi:hypothetical protein
MRDPYEIEDGALGTVCRFEGGFNPGYLVLLDNGRHVKLPGVLMELYDPLKPARSNPAPRPEPVPGSSDDDTPTFHVGDCPCGQDDCTSVVFGITNPQIKEREGDALFYVNFPLRHAQDLVDELRRRAAARGIVLI